MEKTKTIGQIASEKAIEAFELYKKFKKEFGDEKAKNLALHDLTVEKLIAEYAIAELVEKIKEDSN